MRGRVDTMSWVVRGLMIVCILTIAMAAGGASGFEADLTMESVDHPGTGALLPGGDVNMTVFVHDGGTPLIDSAALYTMFPDGSYLPEGWPFTSEADGWFNVSLATSYPYAGTYVYSVCDPDSQDGWGGGDGFFLDSVSLDLLGVTTDRTFYAPGDTVWYSVLNDLAVTNVTDVGTIEVYDDQHSSVSDPLEGPEGGFEIPLTYDPGIYELRTEFGGLIGTFTVSDVSVFPAKDIYHFGETITVHTSLDLDMSVISPSGSVQNSNIYETTDVALPGSGDPGFYTLTMLLDGVTMFRDRIHVSYCDLWADTTMDVYEPGSLTKTYFSARDIGMGLDDFEELDWDVIYNTVDGVERVQDQLNKLNGYDTFTSVPDVVYGDSLWATGADNRIEFYLNISSRTVRKTVPLAFGEPIITVEGATHFGTDEPLKLTISTEILGERPVWWIRTPHGDVTSYVPPMSEGTDPFDRPLMRVGDLIYFVESSGYTIEKVSSPVRNVDIEVEVGSEETDLTTDGSGKAVLFHGSMEEGSHSISISSVGYPTTRHIVSVSGGSRSLSFIGPEIVVAGEDADYNVVVMDSNESVTARVDYVAEFLDGAFDAGTTEEEITITMPESDGTVRLLGSAVVNGSLVTGSLDIEVTSSQVFIEHVGKYPVRRSGNGFMIRYAVPNVTEDAVIEYEALGGLRSGNLSSSVGDFRIYVPSGWDDDFVKVTVRAFDNGRAVEGSIVLYFEGWAEVHVPTSVENRKTFVLGYQTNPWGGDGEFLGAFLTIRQDHRYDTIAKSYNVTSPNGTVMVTDLVAGDYTVTLTAQYLTSDGIETMDTHVPLHVKEAVSDDDDDGFDIMYLVAMVLIVVILVLLIALAGSQRKIRKLKKDDEKHTRRAKKFKKKLEELEALLPSEEGHRIPARRPSRIVDEIEEEVEEEMEEEPGEEVEVSEPEPPTSEAVDDEVSMATEAPCPMCGVAVYIPAKRPATVRCAGCSFEFIVE